MKVRVYDSSEGKRVSMSFREWRHSKRAGAVYIVAFFIAGLVLGYVWTTL